MLEYVFVSDLQDLLTYRCTSEATATTKIYKALLSLPNDKVSGPNGFTKEFFVAAWPILGGDFIVVIQSFFIFGFLLTGVNAPVLALISKTENAQTMKDFKPIIACCNLLYNVISKVLANMLQVIFLDTIESNQCAFIEESLLQENVLLASKLVNRYHQTAGKEKCAVKFDISKAFIQLNGLSSPIFFKQWDCLLNSSIG